MYRFANAMSCVALAFAVGACASELASPPDDVEGTITVDASTAWAYASLPAKGLVTVPTPRTSSAWDIAFNATSVMLNGGAAGPGGVAGVCLCANSGATNPEILAMTPENQLAAFDAVKAANIPAAETFETEALVLAIGGWFTGTGAAATAVSDKVWLLRLSNGTSFAKFRVVSLTTPTATHAGNIAIEYAVQTDAASAFGTTQTATLNAGSGTTIDLATGTLGGGTWDLKADGFTLLMNSGVSGTGQAGAATSTESFGAVTTASTDPRAYRKDSFAGVFGTHPWYKYDLTGEHLIHPTFNVYLLKRGSVVYKVQVINYYGSTGETRQITFRYAQLAS